MSALTRIEETYLKLFKIVLLLILSVALLAAIGLLIKGAIDSTAEPETVTPARSAPAPGVSFEGFLESQETTVTPSPEPAPPAAPAPAPAPRVDPLDQMVNKYMDSTWVVYDAFQKGCMSEDPVSQEDFLGWDGLRAFYRGNFEELGESFAQSQDRFVSTVYSDPRVIELCIKRQGKGQLFSGGLEWHREQWIDSVQASEQFARSEMERVEREEASQRRQAAAKRAEATRMLWGALIAFGVFMSIALLLIFSKIETNLRMLREVKITGRDDTQAPG